MLNKTKWAVCSKAPLTRSGLDEVVAPFVTKAEAEIYARDLGGRRWRRDFTVRRTQ